MLNRFIAKKPLYLIFLNCRARNAKTLVKDLPYLSLVILLDFNRYFILTEDNMDKLTCPGFEILQK